VAIMTGESLKCSVCGGAMHRVKVLPIKFGRLIRFKCTCGHSEDVKDDKPLAQGNGHVVLIVPGFQELR
jgi:hypothetical protein